MLCICFLFYRSAVRHYWGFMRKQVYSMALDPPVVEAVDGAVHYFKYKSRSAFITAAIESLLEELHKTLLEERKKIENQ